ncbi:cuticle protein 19-like [Penaeus monodon]|uniref:cuticle protein 19-like n=1 Tax=Penaeus monodon TaxID=6687 RepID=UPI0018A72807|nr:cuticle protein 19-like [Penaeus monodon]
MFPVAGPVMDIPSPDYPPSLPELCLETLLPRASSLTNMVGTGGLVYAVDGQRTRQHNLPKRYSEGDTMKGEYRVLLPDGRTQIVTYSSDPERGYMARVSYEGTARPYTPPQAEKYASIRNKP